MTSFLGTNMLIQLNDKTSNVLDNRMVTLGLFTDLTKAFNSVIHEILLDKLEQKGIVCIALQRFKGASLF